MATTIRLTDDTRDLLKEEQLPNESMNDTVRRLLGESEGRVWTKEELWDIVDDRLNERVVGEAQR